MEHLKKIFSAMLKDFERQQGQKIAYLSPTVKNAMLYRHCISPHTIATTPKDDVIELAFLAADHYQE